MSIRWFHIFEKNFFRKINLERISHKNAKNISYNNSRIKLCIILYLDTKQNYTLGLTIFYCIVLNWWNLYKALKEWNKGNHQHTIEELRAREWAKTICFDSQP